MFFKVNIVEYIDLKLVVVFSNDPVVFSNVFIDIPSFTSDIVDLYVLYFTSQRARGLLVYQSESIFLILTQGVKIFFH